MANMTRGRLANRAKVTISTVLYCTNHGLLAEPHRGSNGYRLYPEKDVQRINFIKKAQSLGFSLDEIGSLLQLKFSEKCQCASVKKFVNKKVVEIDQKIAEFEQIRSALTKLIDTESIDDSLADCPIFEALEMIHSPAKNKKGDHS